MIVKLNTNYPYTSTANFLAGCYNNINYAIKKNDNLICSISTTNLIVKSGSSFEINGNIYIVTADESIAIPIVPVDQWLKFSESSGFSISTGRGTFSASLNGWYNSGVKTLKIKIARSQPTIFYSQIDESINSEQRDGIVCNAYVIDDTPSNLIMPVLSTIGDAVPKTYYSSEFVIKKPFIGYAVPDYFPQPVPGYTRLEIKLNSNWLTYRDFTYPSGPTDMFFLNPVVDIIPGRYRLAWFFNLAGTVANQFGSYLYVHSVYGSDYIFSGDY